MREGRAETRWRLSDFYINTNQEVFTAIRRMHVAVKPIDGLTVASELEREGLYSSETRNYLLQCMEITPTSANVLEYTGIVRKKAVEKRPLHQGGDGGAGHGRGPAGGGGGDMPPKDALTAGRMGRKPCRMLMSGGH